MLIRPSPRSTVGGWQPAGSATAHALVLILWQIIRLPVLAVLVVLEPIIYRVCTTLSLFGILVSFLFKLAGAPHFPFALMLAISAALGLVLIGYYALIRLLSKPA